MWSRAPAHTTTMSQDTRATRNDAEEVRIAVTEGLGTFWLAPRLVEFQAAHPGLLMNLSCAMEPVARPPHPCEAVVQLVKPTHRDCEIVRLGRLHSMPFAAPDYLEVHGIPKTLQELSRHRIILQLAEQTATREHYERMLPVLPDAGFIAVRTNTSSAHYWTIANGGGIGMLPTYAVAIGARVVPIDVGLCFPFDVWLVHHPDGRRIAHVKRTIEWLIDSFDQRRFPWFADDFIHPSDLLKRYDGAPISNVFESLISPTTQTTSIH
jgi:DNA-binding transcriptional LysR family regulator